MPSEGHFYRQLPFVLCLLFGATVLLTWVSAPVGDLQQTAAANLVADAIHELASE